MALTLTIVGCAGSFPSAESPASCYLLQAPYQGRTYSVVMDLGNGALGPLQRYVDPLAVDAVVLSHLHADHCLDMCGYYVMRKYHPDGELPRIPVYGPSGTATHLARAYDLPMPVGMTEQFAFADWHAGGGVELGPFRITPSRMSHPVEAYALRVEAGGRALVYSGDTGPTDALVELADGADALLCEASFIESRENPPGIHLTGKEAGEHAARANVGRLLVTHIPTWTDRETVAAEAKRAYEGPVDLVEAGDRYTI
ncbi:MBL fold metallo-hydrolase [Solicola gregarius]|uniref:MBL fold metallo-hydrolase n=1 Tax=Solicola gregarius TaxID=2908642 RepID=A0AA46YJ62_9ACTN|nr:MBL fold metallo-hydrolase [Solicola gregarius]UYM04170.1 MBL fold metallo-hydrolase [Solicola gregarius]